MRGRTLSGFIFSTLGLVAAIGIADAQPSLGAEDLARVDAAVRSAFRSLYALPRDTAGAQMGSWVLDTASTTPDGEQTGRWRIVVTRLADTGQDLRLADLLRDGGTSPAELAASVAAMQRLEGTISKAEADTALEVIVTLNWADVTASRVSDDADRSKAAIAGANLATRIRGDWVHLDDRELDVDYEHWSPGTLIVGFGAFGPLETRRATAKDSLSTFVAHARPTPGTRAIHTIGVTAQGNEEMIDRLIRETNWAALATLVQQ